MPRYYFHVYNSVGFTSDEQGLLFPDSAGAIAQAVESIRSILAEDLRSTGLIDLRGRIEMVDEGGSITTIRFGDAVSVQETE
jgi:hypothetical protein